ncbi:MAG: hypothetical protein COB22_02060 [Cycloclasticus sp.]|nr:MAG: hypothetical protein COB22_02060 [Cycloclasticus sp.]
MMAKNLIKKIAKDSSRVIFTKHAEKRMCTRKITRTQVLKCLTHGHIVEGPALSIKGNMEMKIEVMSAGEIIAVVTALEKDELGNFVVIITVFGA